ncbi:MAG: sensor histidine kinase [Pirellulales bacterium]
MPRTRLVWQLCAGFCVVLSLALAAAFWVASVHLAGLADAAEFARLTDVARDLAAAGPDPEAFSIRSRELREATGLETRLFAGGASAATNPAGSAGEPLVAEARSGRVARGSRYDSATGRRLLTVAVPVPPAVTGSPPAIVVAATDSATSDERLAAWQWRLLGSCLAVAAAAAAGGYAVARRMSRPVEDLAAAAARMAGGDVGAPIPTGEMAETAELSAALTAVREQLVERGLTIGRQGTQQEAVLGSMIEGVLAVDARQRIVGINRAAAELLGVDAARAAGRPLQEAVRNPDLRRFALKAIDCREPVEDDLVLRGDRDRTIRLRGTALRDVSGEGGAVVVLNDVTDVQRLENVRRDFDANVSHELKPPIASIKGFVETLLDGAVDDPADTRRFLGIVARQADRLAAIIEDLLALSRIEQREGAGNLPMENVSVAGVIAAAVADCSPRAGERSIRLEADCPADLVRAVNAPLLEQALINLVDNAINSSEAGRSIWISATAEPAEAAGGVTIRIRDEGCGIEPEHLPRLFERFYRVDKARSRNLGGTGLGLSIVKHIVQAHGGTVGVESTPGVGTTFTIRLPGGA